MVLQSPFESMPQWHWQSQWHTRVRHSNAKIRINLEKDDMAYWGSGPIDNDYAFDAVSTYVYLIKERMFQDADTVVRKSHPEQGIVASLQCLRLLASQFPKCVKVHFRKKDLEKAKEAFGAWYDAVQERLPKDYCETIRLGAESEFRLFESQVLSLN